ncbi:MAG: putative sugar nucleotidyl transferase [Balneola sp.]|jgi:UDP-N-acetylglucosamine diphosphorylase/glucosamine-1-phosphate N-acetyltransferase
MQIIFFEDTIARRFKPLTLTRPLWDLRVGILTIFEKWKYSLNPDSIAWEAQPYLKKLFPSPSPDKDKACLYINSRFLPSQKLLDLLAKAQINEAFYYNDEPVCFMSDKPHTELTYSILESANRTELDFKPVFVEYLWELLESNGKQIMEDIKLLDIPSIKGSEIANGTVLVEPDNIFIAKDATVEPGVILMADKGPVFIGPNAVIEAGAILKGPVAVCNNATVKMRARIYDSSTIGPFSKVGGEVSSTIFHSYSNKAHDGFVGNSIFGQWCNLGADSNTSNLKNNYDFVRIQDWETKEFYRVGFQFFGTVMGDHSKTSINSMLSTGTTCGVSSNIFTSDFPPKYIPSFTWLDGVKNPEFRFDKALEVMKAMMARRKIELSDEYEHMMRYLFNERSS